MSPFTVYTPFEYTSLRLRPLVSSCPALCLQKGNYDYNAYPYASTGATLHEHARLAAQAWDLQ
jgi:hypothetical protein